MSKRTPARKGTRKPAAQPAPVAEIPPPIAAELRAAFRANPDKSLGDVMKDYMDEKVRREMRENAFVEMSPAMFRAVERLIHDDLTEAVGHFNEYGRLTDNRLHEVHDLLIRATALSSALLTVGECIR